MPINLENDAREAREVLDPPPNPPRFIRGEIVHHHADVYDISGCKPSDKGTAQIISGGVGGQGAPVRPAT